MILSVCSLLVNQKFSKPQTGGEQNYKLLANNFLLSGCSSEFL